MSHMLIQHEVKDYISWRKIFDLSLPIRKVFGEKSCRIFRNMENPNDITVLLDMSDINKAEKYAESKDFRSSMKKAGVISTPQVYLAQDEIEA